uniref:Uncharacterized protein n=1 Tax=Arundo donax TaxID=35708 RepID=A0A0A9ADJ2_ARUDO
MPKRQTIFYQVEPMVQNTRQTPKYMVIIVLMPKFKGKRSNTR